MKFGMIGLGKMGLNLVKNAADNNLEVVVNDLNLEAIQEAESYSPKITGSATLTDFLSNLTSPRIIWLMLPAGKITNVMVDRLSRELNPDDILIDGGNSNYKDNLSQEDELKKKGIHFFDVGTSGGMSGARQGGNFMIGGPSEIWPIIEPLFQALAQKEGYLYTGSLGSGHYLKMVHNGIEYGMMQAIAEGFEILDAGPYDYDFPEVAQLWNHGSVIRSWLMELAGEAFAKDPKLEQIASRMYSSGEGK
ncbi:MAG: decarboxylating 6-phosphogluconate dehydrogenase, partial [Streptococcaceae bacterium]|nr:decarboxylating 6-phosphogluconate dehydrogenase [Streptococcaceae bacterium]